MFSKAQTLSKTNIDAHMLKYTEWGAVAYLTQSQYRRNGTEVSVNQCSSYITGAGRGIWAKTDNPIYNSTYNSSTITDDQRYDGNIGKLSSTTGNVYGIYDMSGEAYEYVMGVYGTNDFPTIGSSGFTEIPDSKYYDLYTTTSANNIRGAFFYDTFSAGVFFFGRVYGRWLQRLQFPCMSSSIVMWYLLSDKYQKKIDIT